MMSPTDPGAIALAASFFGGFVEHDLHKLGMPEHFSVRPEHVMEIYVRLRSNPYAYATDCVLGGKIVSSHALRCSKCKGTIAPGAPVYIRDCEWKLQWCEACWSAAIVKHQQECAEAQAREVIREREMAERHASRITGHRAARLAERVNPDQLPMFSEMKP